MLEMGVIVNNTNFSIRFSLTLLKLFGLWRDENLRGCTTYLYSCYTLFVFLFILGTFIVIQLVDLMNIWGDIPSMTASAFLLFTNLAHSMKILNLLARKHRIQQIVSRVDEVLRNERSEEAREIIERCNRGTNIHLFIFVSLTLTTTVGWAAVPLEFSDRQLPLRAWYPYDATQSPAYELTYIHQTCAVILAAGLNVSKDTLLSTLLAQSRCRLALVSLRLKSLCCDEHIKEVRLTKIQESGVRDRLGEAVREHQDVLETVVLLQDCFSEPTFVQFTVSLVIICVTAFQLIFGGSTPVRTLSMSCYLVNMIEQIFIYCYEGNELSAESENISRAAYEFPWYTCSVSTRRSVLIMMSRCRRIAKLTAAGFTTLSLASFMSVLKASYSYFTVLRQLNEKQV